MSLDMPKHCPTCGENIRGFGHRDTCPERNAPASLPRPEIDVCSACGENTLFQWDSVEGWTSICCAARPIDVDREPPDDVGIETWFREDR